MDTGLKHSSIAQVEAAAACVGVILLILVVITVVVLIIILVMRYKMKENSEFVVHVSRHVNDSEWSHDKDHHDKYPDYDHPRSFLKSKTSFEPAVDTQENPIYNQPRLTTSSFINESAPEVEHAFHNPEVEVENKNDSEQDSDEWDSQEGDFEKTVDDVTLLPEQQETKQEVPSMQQKHEYSGGNGVMSDEIKNPPIALPRTTTPEIKSGSPRRPPPVAPVKPKPYSAKTSDKPPISAKPTPPKPTKPTKPKPPPPGAKPFAYTLGDSSLLKQSSQQCSAQEQGNQEGTKVTVRPELKPKPKIVPRRNV